MTDMFPEVVPAEDPNRRYTTAAFMEWIKAKAGVDAWDVDVAADAESHWAPRWFSVCPYPGSAGVNGLMQSWLPELCDCAATNPPEPGYSRLAHYDPAIELWRIYCNPPFDDLGSWIVNAWDACERASLAGLELRIGFVLPGNRHEQPFWQEMIEPFRDGRATRDGYRLDLHFPAGRQAYAKPGSNGVAIGSADFPSCLLVWRRA